MGEEGGWREEGGREGGERGDGHSFIRSVLEG